MFLIMDYVTWLSMHFQTISTSYMNKMGLKYSLSITTLTIWLGVIVFIYGPDVIEEFCYKTVTVSYEVVGFLKFILRCDWVDKKNCKWTWLLPVLSCQYLGFCKQTTGNEVNLWSLQWTKLRSIRVCEPSEFDIMILNLNKKFTREVKFVLLFSSCHLR